MASAAAGAHRQATTTAERASESSRDLTSIAAAIEQMAASVDEIARQVTSAAEIARRASERAGANQDTLRGLSNAAQRIGEVIKLIDGVAEQTNLLALNATIEAARAGEAGKGFAVVAGEVKALARQTANATADINAQIAAVRGSSEAVVRAMTEIASVISEMDLVAGAISAATREQSAAIREIAASVQTVTGATNDTARAMADVVEAADNADAVSRTVLEGVGRIGREAMAMRSEIDQFLVAVRDERDDRRRHERVDGHQSRVAVRVPGQPAQAGLLRDISMGGASIEGSLRLTAGEEVEVDLPYLNGTVAGRVTRCENQIASIVFRQDDVNQDRLAATIDALVGQTKAA
jgi:methyl-accepting chemotaxis protein